jgi:hypothetical protein
MRNMRALGFVALVTLLGSLLFGFRKPKAVIKYDEASEASARRNQEPALVNAYMAEPTSGPVADLVHERARQRRVEQEDSRNEWRTPIAFYGKVIDEKNQAIPGAAVEFSCNDLSASGTSEYQRSSDSEGLFSITGIAGKLLVVHVAKAGFYSSRVDNDSFYYAGQNINFSPSIVRPEIFHLVRQGTGEALVHIQSPLGGGKDFRIRKDGTPIEISLLSGKVVPSGTGDLRVECWTYDGTKAARQRYNWRCRITVPNGGLQSYTQEFPFNAPIEGYLSYDDIDMSDTLDQGWGTNAKRKYFVKLRNGKYARLTFEMIAGGDQFFVLESFLNPSGSRNLEFDPNNVVPPSD